MRVIAILIMTDLNKKIQELGLCIKALEAREPQIIKTTVVEKQPESQVVETPVL
jgi:hypothetical protein